jgi:hypothetical protein
MIAKRQDAALWRMIRTARLIAARERRERTAEAAKLEAQLGRRLDALDQAELQDLAAAALPAFDVRRYHGRYRSDPTARLFLLRRLANHGPVSDALPGKSSTRNPPPPRRETCVAAVKPGQACVAPGVRLRAMTSSRTREAEGNLSR